MASNNIIWHDTWDSLVVGVNGGLETVLTNEVAPVLSDMLFDQIKKDIYGAYTPKAGGWVDVSTIPWRKGVTYERRQSLLGNYAYIFEDFNELTVTSTANPAPSVGKIKFVAEEPGAFLKMLESENIANSLWHGGFPRPAVSNAQRKVDSFLRGSHNKLTGAISRGIKKYIEQ